MRGRAGTILLVAVAALALAGSASEGVSPPTALVDRVGVNVPEDAATGVPATYGRTIFADDGIRLFRVNLNPANAFPSSRRPRWAHLDRTIRLVKQVPGGRMLPVIENSPRWQHPRCQATPSYKCPPDAAHRREWAREVRQMVHHVLAAGVPVSEIELWNEPYCCGFWLPRPSAAGYVALLRTLARTLWATYPSLKIAVSANYWQEGSTCSAGRCPQWFRRVLAADKTRLLNDPRIVFTIHDYVLAHSPADALATGWSFNRYLLARDQAVKHGKRDPQFEITEFGWEANTGRVAFNDGVTEQQQAAFTVQAAHLALTDPCRCVSRVFIFSDYRGNDSRGNTTGYNMHRIDGTRRPVAAAVKAYIQAGTP
jgi:hypothetical protein